MDNRGRREPIVKNNVSMAYNMLKDGLTRDQVAQYFITNKKLGEEAIDKLVEKARALIDNESYRDVYITIAQHDRRYEDIWEQDKDIFQFWTPSPSKKHEFYGNSEIIRRYRALLKALKQREAIYGLHSKEVNIAIENELLITGNGKSHGVKTLKKGSLHHINETFDFGKLELDEKIELLELLKLCYTGKLDNETDDFVKENYEDDDDQEVKHVDNRRSRSVIKEGFDDIQDAEVVESNVSQETASIKIIDLTPKVDKKDDFQAGEDLRAAMLERIRSKYVNKS